VSTSVFLFTDIEGSTRLWNAHGDAMGAALERHDEILRSAVTAGSGTIVKHTGDGIVARFDSASDALAAAVEIPRRLGEENWGALGALSVRIGLHAGEAQERGGDWFGPALNRTARLMAVGHGGQVLVSGAAAALVGDAPAGGVALVDLGMHRLRDLAQPEHVFQVRAAGLRETFPPLRALDAFKGNCRRS
jgi:class 3 adenylate cyclase